MTTSPTRADSHRLQAPPARSTARGNARRIRWFTPALAGAAALACGMAAHANPTPAEQWASEMGNSFDDPSGSPIAFEIDLCGDVTGLIPAQSMSAAGLNPFIWSNANVAGHTVNPTTVTYDPAANLTRVVQSGSPLPYPIPTNYSIWHLDGNGHPTWHTGINYGATVPTALAGVAGAAASRGASPAVCDPAAGPFQVVSRHWTYEDDHTSELDAVTFSWNGHLTKRSEGVVWLLTYFEFADPTTGAVRSGEWRVTPQDPTRSHQFTLTNRSAQPLLVSRIGYIPGVPLPTDPQCRKNPACDGNELMLQSLNDGGYPAPGEPGSRFTTVKAPRTPIPPGGTLTIKTR